MTLFELLNVDLVKLEEILESDQGLARAFDNLFDRIGYMIEGGRAHWIEVDHDLNCTHCKNKVVH